MVPSLSKHAKEILARLSPERADSRADWITCGYALHRFFKGSDEGFQLWDEWSRQSEKYKEGECESKWQEFHTGGVPGAGMNTLKRWASEDRLAPASVDHDPEPSKHEELSSLVIRDMSAKLKAGMKTNIVVDLDGLILDSCRRANGVEAGRWFYQSAKGEDVLCILRIQRLQNEKTYRQFRKEDGRWMVGGIESNCPLYSLVRISEDNRFTAYICEGEKCADSLLKLGLTATTSAQGAQSPRKTDWSPLAGREVVILPDNDEAGRKYAQTVLSILGGLTPPAKVRRVELPVAEKGDAFDFIQEHGKEVAIRKLAEFVEKAKYITADQYEGELMLHNMENVEEEEIEWLWKNRIPKGGITLIAGKPGEGKSWLTTDFAAHVSRGIPWPDGLPCEQGRVMMLVGEDPIGSVVKPRLRVHGADFKFIMAGAMTKKESPNGEITEKIFRLGDLRKLERKLQAYDDWKLIIIDPVSSFTGGETDTWRDNEVRDILAPLTKLAEKYNLAVIIVVHRPKKGGVDADSQVLGSVAYTAISRAVHHVYMDNEDTSHTRRLFLPGKINIAPKSKGLAFSIEGDPAKVVWGGAVETRADDVAADNSRPSKQNGEKDKEYAGWIEALLTERGELSMSAVRKAATEAGYQFSIVNRVAREILNVDRKQQDGGGWIWRLETEKTDASN